MTTRVGIIGFGAIGQSIAEAWRMRAVPGHVLAAVLVRETQREAARAALPQDVAVVTGISAFISLGLDCAVEVAGQAAVAEVGEAVLANGADLMVISVGALVDPALRQRLADAAERGGGQVLLPVGAIAGLDGLAAMRRGGLSKVTYTSTKPPHAWKGTPAEAAFDLAALTGPTVVFEGNAADAARLYPKNANLAAAVALAGLGLEATHVRLVADPAVDRNTGHIEAESPTSRLVVTVEGRSAPGNPKTSMVTGMSVLAALENRASTIRFV